MTDDRPLAHSGEGLAAGEREQLVYVLENRLAPALEAAASAVREAERSLADAQDRLARAELAANSPYVSDPLIFMRRSVEEEVDALERKTTAKKIRTSYRFLLDRAVELAGAEVARFHDDQRAQHQERQEGVEACRAAEQRAAAALDEARQMQERVRASEQSARRGLQLLLDKLGPARP
ncbi:MAG: hypothetical protein V9G19_13595 [Tetrasphaera sp.]